MDVQGNEIAAPRSPAGFDLLSPDECRAARSLLKLSRAKVAAAAGLTARTIAAFEAKNSRATMRTQRLVRALLEARGVQFLAGGVVPVRLRAVRRPAAIDPAFFRRMLRIRD